MKLRWALPVIAILHTLAQAQETRFFRISGPIASTITSFTADGKISWTNLPTISTFTVQTTSKIEPAQWVDYVQVPVTNELTFLHLYAPNTPVGMAFIPAGTFVMGNSMIPEEGDADELPQHTVQVSAYFMDRFSVTKALWDDVASWATNHGYTFQWVQGKKANHPVQSVMWYDAVKWCNARSEKEGRIPAYYTNRDLSVPYRTGELEPSVCWNSGYRLPTEAEWEKAARGGSAGHRFPWTDADTISQMRANYAADVDWPYDESPSSVYHPLFNDGIQPYTSPVGFFAPNNYGIYDVAGNVYQLCWDCYGPYLPGSSIDPHGPDSGSYRLVRGGSWTHTGIGCRVSARIGFWPAGQSNLVGFRSVLPAIF